MVATPIGNLADITLRALDVLRSADLVCAEDTRNTSVLLAHHGIGARLKAVHEHNEAHAARDVIEALAAGKTVALVSDAGTPAISDPGALVVAQVRAAGYDIVPIPGPSAVLAGLSAAGMPGPFAFIGFLPSKAAARRKALETWRSFAHTLVLYEAPHRIVECVEDIASVLGDERTVVIARELTKLFETIHACPAHECAAWLREDANRQRGEFVLVVAGAGAAADDIAVRTAAEGERVLKLLLPEMPINRAARLAAQISGARKNDLYERALALGKAQDQ